LERHAAAPEIGHDPEAEAVEDLGFEDGPHAPGDERVVAQVLRQVDEEPAVGLNEPADLQPELAVVGLDLKSAFAGGD
jgi:hypothetical protein